LNDLKATTLINQLLEDSETFFDNGSSYDLLQCYFDGYPVDSLRSLLESKDSFVNRVAIWIASELGINASSVAKSILPLLKSKERYIKYYALDSVMVISSSSEKSFFFHVLNSLLDEDHIIRKHAMFLVSNASDFLLEEALKECGINSENEHARGLSLLLAEANIILFEEFKNESSDLLNAYSAIYVKRHIDSLPKDVKEAVYSDSSINSFIDDYCN